MTWQPIETAPKDGSIFIAYVPDQQPIYRNYGAHSFDQSHIFLCYWDRYTDPQQHQYDPLGWTHPLIEHMQMRAQPIIELNHPTHWMPLPEPPK